MKVAGNIFASLILIACLVFFGFILFQHFNPDFKSSNSHYENTTNTENDESMQQQERLVANETDYDAPTTPLVNDDNEYRKLMFGDHDLGQLVILTGTVQQILGNNRVLVATQPLQPLNIYDLLQNGIQFSGRDIILNFKEAPRVLQGDVIVVKGRYFGTVEYELVLTKNTAKLPKIEVDFYESGQRNEKRIMHFFDGYKANVQKVKQEQEVAELAAQAANTSEIDDKPNDIARQNEPEKGVAEPPLEINEELPPTIEEPSYIRPPRLNITDSDLKGQSRTMKLSFDITSKGKVENIEVLESTGLLDVDQKIINAMKRALFVPKKENGIGVASRSSQSFTLSAEEN